MEDVKVQLTKENIEYKNKIGTSFAKLINTLISMSRTSKDIEHELINQIKKLNDTTHK